jgi:hypothetical protein
MLQAVQIDSQELMSAGRERVLQMFSIAALAGALEQLLTR